jgi:hypothetical protein
VFSKGLSDILDNFLLFVKHPLFPGRISLKIKTKKNICQKVTFMAMAWIDLVKIILSVLYRGKKYWIQYMFVHVT